MALTTALEAPREASRSRVEPNVFVEQHDENPSSETLTWTPKVCKIMAFMAIIRGLGLFFYILLGFRYCLNPTSGAGARWRRPHHSIGRLVGSVLALSPEVGFRELAILRA